jgi:hypothetical protein
MRLLQTILIIAFSGLFAGCENLVNDLDEDELPRVESKLTLSCYISPQLPLIDVKVTESQPLLGPAQYEARVIGDANVVLSSESGQVRIPFNDSLGIYRIDSSAFKIRPGQTYTLLVNDAKRSVKATCTVPAKIPSSRLDVTILPAGFNSDSLLSIHTSWVDITGEKNYYSVTGVITQKLRSPTWNFETGEVNIDPKTGEIILQEQTYVSLTLSGPSNDNLFTDTNLDGATFRGPELMWYFQKPQVQVYRDKNGVAHSYSDEARIDEIRMYVMNMDEHYYKFLRSVVGASDNNPFVEPTPIYTNVEGGLGCFGAFNAAIVRHTPGR